MELKQLKVGDRVQLQPTSNRWMRGDRFAEVKKIGRKLVFVKFERSGHDAPVHPLNVLEVVRNIPREVR